MITLSSKSKYAIAALIEIAKQGDDIPIQSIRLAEKRQIPAKLLEQLMNDLKRNGLLKSYRGAKGGYILAKPKETISVLEIIEIMDGPIQIEAHRSDCLTLKSYWEDVSQNLRACFKMTLNELLIKQEKENQILVYSI